MITFLSNCVKLTQDIRQYNEKRIHNYRNAVKIEFFRLRKLLKKEIEESAPGGQKFAPLSEATKKIWKWQFEEMGIKMERFQDRPLFKLSRPIYYKVWTNPTNIHMSIGFVGKMSASMFRLAHIHQEGFSSPLTTRPGSKPGPTVHTPARLIIVPFWARYQREAETNIQSNFERKMRGERI